MSRKPLIPAFFLAVYSAILIKFVVFKSIPTLKIGHMRFKVGGPYHTGDPNFVPFKTIWTYVSGQYGRVIGAVNLMGNILPFIPVGFLVPFIYRKMTWSKAFALAVGTGLVMEVMEVVFRVGIFDVDDVLLNGLGVLMGYGLFTVFVKADH